MQTVLCRPRPCPCRAARPCAAAAGCGARRAWRSTGCTLMACRRALRAWPTGGWAGQVGRGTPMCSTCEMRSGGTRAFTFTQPEHGCTWARLTLTAAAATAFSAISGHGNGPHVAATLKLTCAPRLLIIALHGLAQSEVDDVTHVRLVDACNTRRQGRQRRGSDRRGRRRLAPLVPGPTAICWQQPTHGRRVKATPSCCS